MGVYMRVDVQWWQPWEDTVAYRPLTSTTTVNDESWNGNTLTNAWVSFATYNGVSCARITWNADSYHTTNQYLYWDITGLPIWANPRTFSLWVYQDNAASSWEACYLYQGKTYTDGQVVLIQWSGGVYINTYWNNSATYVGFVTPTIWQRHNNVLVYDWSNFVYYVNGVQKITWSRTISTHNSNFSLWWAGGGSLQGLNSFNWWLSDAIIEDKAWTQQDVTDYYNLTKSLYGIS